MQFFRLARLTVWAALGKMSLSFGRVVLKYFNVIPCEIIVLFRRLSRKLSEKFVWFMKKINHLAKFHLEKGWIGRGCLPSFPQKYCTSGPTPRRLKIRSLDPGSTPQEDHVMRRNIIGCLAEGKKYLGGGCGPCEQGRI